MKKIVFIIVSLLCALTASAVGYASPYKGAGHTGYIYTTSSARVHSYGSNGGFAQAPTASISSVNRTSGIASRTTVTSVSAPTVAVVPVRGIRTAASSIQGGVTTYDTRSYKKGPKKSQDYPTAPPEIPGCECDWQEGENGDWVCSECGAVYNEYDEDFVDCDHTHDYCPCVPLTDGWLVWLFIALLAAVYTAWKRYKILSV